MPKASFPLPSCPWRSENEGLDRSVKVYSLLACHAVHIVYVDATLTSALFKRCFSHTGVKKYGRSH